MGEVLLPVACLRELCDPLSDPPWFVEPWDIGPIEPREIDEAVSAGLLLEDEFRLSLVDVWDRAAHVARIAYLVVHGWTDPIELYVGTPSAGLHCDWPLDDGNHRLAAAVHRGDEFILASVDGDLDHAFEVFGVDCVGKAAA